MDNTLEQTALVVDDKVSVRDAHISALVSLGFHRESIIETSSGFGGAKILQQVVDGLREKFTIVVTDQQMPGGFGDVMLARFDVGEVADHVVMLSLGKKPDGLDPRVVFSQDKPAQPWFFQEILDES